MTLTVYSELEQGSDEWIQARAGIVTASTVGKLLTSTGRVASNDTSRTLIETLVAERITGRVEHMHPTRDMQRGTLLEPFARDAYETHHALVHMTGFMVRDDWGYKIGYSPDGLVGDDGLLEIKSRKPRIHIKTIRDDRVPAANMAQLQAGLLVSGRQWIDYCSYSPGLPLYVRRIWPDDKWQSAILATTELFEDHAQSLIEDYRRDTRGLPATEYIDPFAIEEDEVIYG